MLNQLAFVGEQIDLPSIFSHNAVQKAAFADIAVGGHVADREKHFIRTVMQYLLNGIVPSDDVWTLFDSPAEADHVNIVFPKLNGKAQVVGNDAQLALFCQKGGDILHRRAAVQKDGISVSDQLRRRVGVAALFLFVCRNVIDFFERFPSRVAEAILVSR